MVGCGGRVQAMGIESAFACKTLWSRHLAGKGESRFRTFGWSMMFGVSHANASAAQRLRSSRVCGNYVPRNASEHRSQVINASF
jgi:hypothetical protein